MRTPYWKVVNEDRNVAVTTRSMGNPEGGPPGYTLVHLHGEALAVACCSVEERGRSRR